MKAQESNGLRRFLNKGVEATDSPPAKGPEVEPFRGGQRQEGMGP
jgi:hypothetical protein